MKYNVLYYIFKWNIFNNSSIYIYLVYYGRFPQTELQSNKGSSCQYLDKLRLQVTENIAPQQTAQNFLELYNNIIWYLRLSSVSQYIYIYMSYIIRIIISYNIVSYTNYNIDYNVWVHTYIIYVFKYCNHPPFVRKWLFWYWILVTKKYLGIKNIIRFRIYNTGPFWSNKIIVYDY